MPLSSQTRNENCMRLERKYRSARQELKKKIAERRLNMSIPMNEHMRHVFQLHKVPRNSSLTRIRRRCTITGRGRGVFRFFGICGAKIRELSMKGMLPGVRHASW